MKQLIKLLHPKFQKLILDYPVVFKPRYGHGLPPNEMLQKTISQTDSNYFESLNRKVKADLFGTTSFFQDLIWSPCILC
jgi:hypothetical protein